MLTIRNWQWLLTIWLAMISLPSYGVNTPSFCHQRNPSLYFSHYSTDHFWNKHGKKLPTYNHFKKTSIHAFLEYDHSPIDSFGLYIAFSHIKESINSHTHDFNDIEFSWMHQLYQTETSCYAIQVTGVIPAEHEFQPELSYGNFGVELSGFYANHFTFKNNPGCLELALRYRTYQGFPSDLIRADIVVSYDLSRRLYINAGAYLDYGLFNGKHRDNTNIVLLNPNYRLLSTQVQAVFRFFDQLTVGLGYFHHIWGNNVGTGNGLLAGSSLTF